MAQILLVPTDPTINTPVPEYISGTSVVFAAQLGTNQDTLESRDALVMAALEMLQAALGNGSLSGGAMSAGTGLSVNVAALAALVGTWVGFDASQVVGGLTDASLNYLYLRQDGTWTVNTTGVTPLSTDGHGAALLWGTATTSAGAVTAVSNVRRSFAQALSRILITTSNPTNAVTGDMWYRSDLNELHVQGGGTLTSSGGGGGTFAWQGAWDGSTSYAVGDAVSSGGSSYICINAHVNHAPPDATYWDVLAAEGATGAAGATGPAGPSGAQGFNWAGAWSGVTAYVPYDVVSYGALYIAIANTTNDIPSVSPSKWDVYLPAGTAGTPGTAGATGAAGSIWYNGTTDPAGGLGADNDYYINTTSLDYFQKVGGSWVMLGNMRGAQGTPGLQGANGQGVPTGGTTGQTLTKNSNTDFDTHWTTPSGTGDMLASTYDPDVDGIIAIAQGGTGASTASAARTNLGLGSAAVQNTSAFDAAGAAAAAQAASQPLDADLTTIAGLTATTDNFLQAKASAWSSRTPTQVTADLMPVVGDSGSGGTKGLVPAPGAGDTAAGKFLKADGTWAVPAGGGGSSGWGTPNAQTASYQPVLGDANGVIEITSATPTGLTIPANSTVAFPIGTVIHLTQLGAGAVTVGGAGGTTVHSRGGLLNTNGQYAVVHMYKSGINTWYVYGDLA